jgi:hypothetical protein
MTVLPPLEQAIGDKLVPAIGKESQTLRSGRTYGRTHSLKRLELAFKEGAFWSTLNRKRKLVSLALMHR